MNLAATFGHGLPHKKDVRRVVLDQEHVFCCWAVHICRIRDAAIVGRAVERTQAWLRGQNPPNDPFTDSDHRPGIHGLRRYAHTKSPW
jgi:hypothetical protein